jgi:RNA polymerase sigma factor (sigma-70 family)
MDKNGVIQALRSGGKLREAALAFILSDKKLHADVQNRLKKYRNSVEQFIPASKRAFGGRSIDNVTDYFLLEALFKLDQKVRETREEKKFRGATYEEAAAYLISTAVFICIGLLRKSHQQAGTEAIPEEVEDHLEKSVLNHEKHALLHQVLDRLGKGCKELLLMFYSGYSYEEIAPALGISTPDVAKTQKSRCYRGLLQLIETKPVFAEFLK